MENTSSSQRPVSFYQAVSFGTAFALIGLTGCSSGVAPSKTVSGAGTGAVIGGLGGAAVGSNSSMGSLGGGAIGAGAGALVGGLVGLVQDARDRKEQDRLAQERAYQQDNAKKRAEELKLKAEMEEELSIAQGFRISEIELNDAKKKLETANEKLKRLMDERSTALQKKKDLDDAREKTLATEAKIAQLEEELTRLKGEEVQKDVQVPPPSSEVVQKKPDSRSTPPPPAAKPGTD